MTQDDFFDGTIFALMGKSASGKDSVYSIIMSNLDSFGLSHVKPIVTYTTRPIRTGERDGREYFFVSEGELSSMSADIIERRDYYTEHGCWSYATVDDGQISGDGYYFHLRFLSGFFIILQMTMFCFVKKKLIIVQS